MCVCHTRCCKGYHIFISRPHICYRYIALFRLATGWKVTAQFHRARKCHLSCQLRFRGRKRHENWIGSYPPLPLSFGPRFAISDVSLVSRWINVSENRRSASEKRPDIPASSSEFASLPASSRLDIDEFPRNQFLLASLYSSREIQDFFILPDFDAIISKNISMIVKPMTIKI